MLNIRSISFLLVVASLLALPGCKRSQYIPRSFESVTPTFSGTQTLNNVTLKVAPLSKQDSLQLFDHRGDRLYSKRKPLHPVLITIINESEQSYSFNPKQMEIRVASPRNVARRMYGHTSRRIIAPLLLGSLGATICFFGAAYLVILGTIQQVAMPALVKTGYSLLGISGLFAIGAPTISYYHGSDSYRVNRIIDQDIAQKTALVPIEVASHTATSFLIFSQNRPMPKNWHIVLNEQKTQQPLIFDIQITKEEYHA